MKLSKHEYFCPKCCKKFLSYFFSTDQNYGEFLLRSDKGEIRYLDSFKDSVFDEVSQICDTHPMLKNISRADEAPIFQKLFSFTCDTASDGSRFEIGKGPVCTSCGFHSLKEAPVNFEDGVEVNVSDVTHCAWNSLSELEKKELIHAQIDKLVG